MRYRTRIVEAWDVNNDVTMAAHALWVAMYSVRAADGGQTAGQASATPTDKYAQFGPRERRWEKAIDSLIAFYRIWYGADGANLIAEYFSAQGDVAVNKSATARLRVTRARQRLRGLHDGFIVDGHAIEQLTEQVLPDDDTSGMWFDA